MNRVALGFTDADPRRARLHGDLVQAVNGLAGSIVETPTPAGADTEFAVRHGLGRVPSEMAVLMQDAAGQVYRSRASAWTDEIAYLKFSAAGGPSVRLRLRFR